MNTNLPEGIGPHEGRELELMQAGAKDLALFVELKPDGFESFVEQSAFALVATARLKNRRAAAVSRFSDSMNSRV